MLPMSAIQATDVKMINYSSLLFIPSPPTLGLSFFYRTTLDGNFPCFSFKSAWFWWRLPTLFLPCRKRCKRWGQCKSVHGNKMIFCASSILSETRFLFCHDDEAHHVENHRHVKKLCTVRKLTMKNTNKVSSSLVKKRHVEESSLKCWSEKLLRHWWTSPSQTNVERFFVFLAQFGEPECDGFLTTRWFIITVHSHGEHCMFVSVSLFAVSWRLKLMGGEVDWFRWLWPKLPSNVSAQKPSQPSRIWAFNMSKM